TEVAKTGAVFTGFEDPSFNVDGVVAFKAGLGGGRSAIYEGKPGDLEQVVKVGDTIDVGGIAETVLNLSMGRFALNNADQLAFYATVKDSNGRQFAQIIRADFAQSSVPEPSALAMFACGIIVVVAYARHCVRRGAD